MSVLALALVCLSSSLVFGENVSGTDETKKCQCVPKHLCGPQDCVPLPEQPCYFYHFVHSDCPKADESCCVLAPAESRKERSISKIHRHPECGVLNHGQPSWTLQLVNAKEGYDLVFCGATLITESVALTYAPCVDSKEERTLRLRARSGSRILQERTVTSTIMHEKYDRENIGQYTVALLFVDEPFNIGKHLKTVCLPTAGDIFEKDECVFTGWGRNVGDESSVLSMRKETASVLPVTSCPAPEDSESDFSTGVICVGGDDYQGNCPGDSGGTLACKSPTTGKYELTGIMAFATGVSCMIPKATAFFTDIEFNLNWIESNLA